MFEEKINRTFWLYPARKITSSPVNFIDVITVRNIKVWRDIPGAYIRRYKLVNRRAKGSVASRRVAAPWWWTAAKLLIFPRKTLAARYVVPSTSHGRGDDGGDEIKIHADDGAPFLGRVSRGIRRTSCGAKRAQWRTPRRASSRENITVGRKRLGDSAREKMWGIYPNLQIKFVPW